MNWIKITLVSITILSAICSILMIGKERKPITPVVATLVIIGDVLIIIGIIFC